MLAFDGQETGTATASPGRGDLDAWGGTLKVPDALNCLPAAQRSFGGRNRNHPIYAGPFAVPSPITGLPPTTFSRAHVRSTPNPQMVTFHRTQSSFSAFSPKTHRRVSGLGPHEHAKQKELSVDPKWVDFEMQGIKIALQAAGDAIEQDSDLVDVDWDNLLAGQDDVAGAYLADWIAVDQEGLVHAGEIKASTSYYLDPAYAAKLTGAERALGQLGITFHRDTGTALRANARRLLNIDRAYGDAFTTITLEQVDAIANVVAASNGPTPLGRIEDAIGGPRAAAAAVGRAALCRRLISYDLNLPVDRDTPVEAPRTPKVIVDIRAIDRRVQL